MKEMIIDGKRQVCTIGDLFAYIIREHLIDKWGIKVNKYFYLYHKADARSVMEIAIIKAYKSYDIDKNTPFEGYCFMSVKNAFIKYIQKENRLYQNEIDVTDYDAIAERKPQCYINIPQKYYRVIKGLKKAFKQHTLIQVCKELGLDYNNTYNCLNRYFKGKGEKLC